MLRKPSHLPPVKRFTNVALPVVNTEQITPALLSVLQFGAETAVVAKFANAVQVVPLKSDHARPPVELRAAHNTSPGVRLAQLGAENSTPVTFAGTLQELPS